mmetsp:Transcript_22799/g.56494  ORF Transcript_22799/g.56494 Transcript_22799/m.56494 type:complete len:548 (+) Transcript_22799:178-1821(+)|eukprot:CAMPEP_0116083098 /NCGR_PEP_ID=MMETSP0327-20121206/3087_1 /TAXON_ID=44447 /ORGANISM="Pseudo-nitzschia delicatissima, Strain B596" /LENGTH=547 /DNA_ID=CAMNT_0003573953 /DNA_START=115 /DNA_END=1758 /DNA_ORIENTATION=-
MKFCLGAQSIAVAIFAALASVSSCQAHFPANESTYLNFVIPTDLHHENSWSHVPSSFGRLGLGQEGSMVLPVKMLEGKDHHLCDDIVMEKEIHDHLKIPEGSGNPFILLVERGVCTFVKKARNAQHLGAAALLIADAKHDHLPDVSSQDILSLDDNHTEHENAYRLADDGSGRDISIFTMMIAKKEYQGIRKVIDSKSNSTGILVAEIAWHVPKFEKKVTMELWSSPVDKHTKEFMASNFSSIARTFDLNEMHAKSHEKHEYNEEMNLMTFHERPVLLDGKALGCIGNIKAPDEPCYHLCTNGGRYCHASHHGTVGRDIVKESLRRLCIDKHYKNPKVYWDYIDHFNNFCWDKDYFAADKCIDDAYKHSSIDKKSIESCFSDSGNPDEDKANALLEDSLDLARDRGVYQSPTVHINHEPSAIIYWEGLKPRTVLYSLCNTFTYGKKPHVCYACEMCGDPVACAKRSPMKCLAGDGQEKEDTDAHKEHHNHKKGDKKKGGRHVFRWFMSLFLVGGCLGGYVYYKKMVENGSDGLGSYSLQDAFLSDVN